MKTFLLVIGAVLILGGLSAVLRPKASFQSSTGPDPNDRYPHERLDYYSKERSVVTGYVAMALGLGVCAAGLRLKANKVADRHETSA